MNKISIKKDDTVVVLSGKDKGKQGKVLRVSPKDGKVVVEARYQKVEIEGDGTVRLTIIPGKVKTIKL